MDHIFLEYRGPLNPKPQNPNRIIKAPALYSLSKGGIGSLSAARSKAKDEEDPDYEDFAFFAWIPKGSDRVGFYKSSFQASIKV